MNDICEYCKDEILIDQPCWFNPIDYEDRGLICDRCAEEDIKDTENYLNHLIDKEIGKWVKYYMRHYTL